MIVMADDQLQTLDKFIAQLTGIFSTIGVMLLVALLMAFLLRYLWNTTLPDLFKFNKISYWQAFKLLLIGFILFGGLLK